MAKRSRQRSESAGEDSSDRSPVRTEKSRRVGSPSTHENSDKIQLELMSAIESISGWDWYPEEEKKKLRYTEHCLKYDFLITVVGRVNAGKSSIVNSLLRLKDGQKLKEGLTRTTDTVHVVCSPECAEVMRDSILRIRPDMGFVTRTDIPLPNEFRRAVIVDTPGIESINEQDNMETQSYVPASDLVLFVIMCKNTLSQGEEKFLKHLVGLKKNIILVMSQVDLVEADDVTHLKEELCRVTRPILGKEPEVLTVSSNMEKKADAARGQGLVAEARELEERGGFLELRGQMMDMVGDRVKKLRTCTRDVHESLGRVRQSTVRKLTYTLNVLATLKNQIARLKTKADSTYESLLQEYACGDTARTCNALLSMQSQLLKFVNDFVDYVSNADGEQDMKNRFRSDVKDQAIKTIATDMGSLHSLSNACEAVSRYLDEAICQLEAKSSGGDCFVANAKNNKNACTHCVVKAHLENMRGLREFLLGGNRGSEGKVTNGVMLRAIGQEAQNIAHDAGFWTNLQDELIARLLQPGRQEAAASNIPTSTAAAAAGGVGLTALLLPTLLVPVVGVATAAGSAFSAFGQLRKKFASATAKRQAQKFAKSQITQLCVRISMAVEHQVRSSIGATIVDFKRSIDELSDMIEEEVLASLKKHLNELEAQGLRITS